MTNDQSIGTMSCLVKNADGSPQNVSRTFPTPLREFIRCFGLPWSFPRLFGWADTDDLTWDRETECRDVDWLGGAFLMIRGDLIRQIGLLDEDFFFYGEDIEFAHRVRKAGYRRFYQATPGSITHLGGGSSSSCPKPRFHRSDSRLQDRQCRHWLPKQIQRIGEPSQTTFAFRMYVPPKVACSASTSVRTPW